MPSLIQRLILGIVPRRWADSIERESRAWQLRCTGCGRARSIWDVGGLRWKASSRAKRTLVRCAACGGMRWGVIEKTAVASAEV